LSLARVIQSNIKWLTRFCDPRCISLRITHRYIWPLKISPRNSVYTHYTRCVENIRQCNATYDTDTLLATQVASSGILRFMQQLRRFTSDMQTTGYNKNQRNILTLFLHRTQYYQFSSRNRAPVTLHSALHQRNRHKSKYTHTFYFNL